MKYINRFLMVSCASLAMFSCIREIDAPLHASRSDKDGDAVSLDSVVFTAVADAFNGTWVEKTDVSVYDGISAEPQNFKVADVDGKSCVLKGCVYSSSELYVALCPSESFSSYSDGIATLLVPAVQALPFESASRALTVAPAVAIDAMTELEFSSMASYVRVYLDADDVVSITLRSKGEVKLSGEADVTVYQKEVKELRGTGDVTLQPRGNTFSKGTYFLQVLPGTYEDGLEVELTFSDLNTYSHALCPAVEVFFGEVSDVGTIHDDDFTVPSVSVSNVAFSSAELSWSASGAVEGYNIYLNGDKVNDEVLPATQDTYHLTGMQTGADNTVEVEAVGLRNVKKSPAENVKTCGVRVLGCGRRHITIEWDEAGKVYTGVGSGSGKDRGYLIGIYTDEACTDKVYEVVPHDGVLTADYAYGNSSYIGKVAGKNYYVPLKLALGALADGTKYYVRVRTLSDYVCTYGTATYTLTHQFGNTAWSDPVEVTTLPAHVPTDDEVVFADFDDIACGVDRRYGAPGTLSKSRLLTSHSDIGVIPLGQVNMSTTPVQLGIAEQGTATDNNYFTGEKFTINGASNKNFIINAGAMTGWHLHDNVRCSMGAVLIETAQNRMVGTPALERNLTDTPRECLLTFETFCFRNNGTTAESPMAIYLLRDGALTKVKDIALSPSYESWTSASDFVVGYNFQQKEIEVSLQRGDAVLICTGVKSGYPTHVMIDNVKIVTK